MIDTLRNYTIAKVLICVCIDSLRAIYVCRIVFTSHTYKKLEPNLELKHNWESKIQKCNIKEKEKKSEKYFRKYWMIN